MAEGIIKIANVDLDTPIGYTHGPIKAETRRRTIRGNMLINRAVSLEDQPISKYPFVITDIVNSKMLDIKAEAVHVGNLYLVDYLLIKEVLSGDNAEQTFYTQRIMNSTTDPAPVITVGGVVKTPVLTADVGGRGRMVFTVAPAAVIDNIIIQYEPKYLIHIPANGFIYTGRIKDVANYTLICEEV
jgi:hypothetical protein